MKMTVDVPDDVYALLQAYAQYMTSRSAVGLEWTAEKAAAVLAESAVKKALRPGETERER